MLKVMAKMGISTLHSYKGAQILKPGLAEDVVELAFKGTASRVSGIDLPLADEMVRRHQLGFQTEPRVRLQLPNPGDFHWRRTGDIHLWDPQSIANPQSAARANSEDAYWAFAKQVNEENTVRQHCAACWNSP